MFVKIQLLDTNFFNVLSSIKPSTKPGVVSVSPPDKVEPVKKHRVGYKLLEIPSHRQPHDDTRTDLVLEPALNKRGLVKNPVGKHGRNAKVEPIKKHRGHKIFEVSNGGVHRKPHADTVTDLVLEPGMNQHGLVKNPDRKHGRNGGRLEKKRGLVSYFRPTNGNNVAHAKCSTKWVRYSGCIPAILEALETVSDLDEALKPWEESLSNKERTIILKEQSSWERALEIFEWFKRKGCYEVNVIHYNIMLRMLGKAQRWRLVESLWDEMGKRSIVPINSTYGTLIDVYSKGGLRDEALLWLGLMNKQGMEPDEVTMGIVVQTYKKAGEFEKAEHFFKKWSSCKTLITSTCNGSESHVCLSSYTYNTLIDTFGKSGQLKEASGTFAQMLRNGNVPNTVTFNTMIHICGNHGQLEEVASLMHKMEELRVPPDTRTYNILISLHAKHDDIKRAANYFLKMKEASLEPDLVSYRTLLYAFSIRHMIGEAEELVSEMDKRGLEIDEFTQSALTRMYIEAGFLEKSWLWFKRFHLEGNMSSECYSANIDAFGERGHCLEAEKVFISCKKLSVLLFNVMIKAYGIGKKYDKACKLFDSMEKRGIVPDKCSYNSLIQTLAGADLPQLALLYVRKMQKAGLVSDCIPYCAVISSFVKLGQLEMAEGVFREMIGFDVLPDVVVYGVLINAFGDIGSVGKTQSYVDAMRDTGIPMNAVICNCLIKLYTKIGYLKEAEETYVMLQSLQVGPDVYSSNCMIDLYSERCMVEQAEDIFEKLKKLGNANEFSYAMMLCMYKRIGMLEEAFRIAQKMRELGFVTDLLSSNHVIGLYASYGRFKDAMTTFTEMLKFGIEPDDSTFKSLGVILVKCGVPKDAVGRLEVTRKTDTQSGLQAWVSTLSSFVGVHNNAFDVHDGY